jgi:transposase InsO family protein
MTMHINDYKLSNLCAALTISRRTYYKYRNQEDPDYFDYVLIKEIFDSSKGTYGYRRIQEGLKQQYGVTYNHKKLQRIMKKYELKPAYIKRIRPHSSYRRIEENVQPNIVKRQFQTQSLNQIWCTDITYLTWGNKRAYLSTIIDLFDRRVVAYKISKFNNMELVLDTLNDAFRKEKDVYGLIIHSDQGFQYTSHPYKAICHSNGVLISMNRKGTPIDDSPMESWHGILKKETLYNNIITSLEHYIQLVHAWIVFYSTTRIKSRDL